MPEELERAIGPDRRSFIKGLVIGTAFAAPVVSSFTMSGVNAVFGATPGPITGAANSNTLPPEAPSNYTDLQCAVVLAKGGTTIEADDGDVHLVLEIPPGALDANTIVCLSKGNLAALAAEAPAGQTPVSAYAVKWSSPGGGSAPANFTIVLTVTDPSVARGDQIYLIDSGSPVADGTATDGVWIVTFDTDPAWIVTHATPAGPSTGGSGSAPSAVVAAPTTTG